MSQNSHRIILVYRRFGSESWTETHQCNRFQFDLIYREMIEIHSFHSENFHKKIDFHH